MTLEQYLTGSNIEQLIPQIAPYLLIIILADLILRGFALWYSARAHQKAWFVCLLIFNTLGILPIIYLIWFRKK